MIIYSVFFFRASYIGAVVNSYSTLMAAHRGEVVCEVKTAKPLDAAMLKEVEGALKGFLKGNEKALITYAVDPSIIGGVRLRIGDELIDGSVATRLRRMGAALQQQGGNDIRSKIDRFLEDDA